MLLVILTEKYTFEPDCTYLQKCLTCNSLHSKSLIRFSDHDTTFHLNFGLFGHAGLRIRIFNFCLKVLTCVLYIIRVMTDNPAHLRNTWLESVWLCVCVFTKLFHLN